MNIKYILIIVILISFAVIGFNIYTFYSKEQHIGKKVTLRRRNAMTPEEFENVLSKMNKKLRDGE